MRRPHHTFCLCCAALAALLPRAAAAQGVPADPARADSAWVEVGEAPPDSALLVPDTVAIRAPVGLPTSGEPGSPPPSGEGRGLEHPITFTARDSLVITFAPEGADGDGEGDVATLFGGATATYDDATLTAREIDLLFDRETLRARGDPDAETDTSAAGRPAFAKGSEGFTGRELAYNLRSERGRVVGARTALDDGFLLGGVVKQVGPRTTYAADVAYTTCEYEDHPHWGLHAHRMKIVGGDWVYTGPARLYLLGIPTPLWLPFGFFPAAEGRRSGPLPPDYGEQDQLGFYLRNLGYYWAISDYTDLQLSGGLYTSGSYEGDARWRYARRYWYSGNLTLGYRVERRGEAQDPNFTRQRSVRVGWQHQQTLDAAETARLTGNVNLSSADYFRTAQSDFDDRVRQSTTSTVSFSKRWRSGRQLSLNLRQSQDFSTGQANLTLPTLSFSQPQRFPFRPEGSRGRRWYEKISVQYTGSLSNTYAFRPQEDSLGNAVAPDVSWLDGILDYDAYREATGEVERFQTEASHSVPVRATFSVERLPLVGVPLQLNLTPNLTYDEDWYARSRRVVTDGDGFALDEDGGVITEDSTGRFAPTVEERVTGFTAIRQVTASLSASSRVYGTFPWRVGPFDGLRHILSPTASLSFAPDYTDDFWGYFQTYKRRTADGGVVEEETPIINGIARQERRRLSLRLRNEFQTRRVREDSTGEVTRDALDLLDLDLSAGYDFAADSLRWSDLSLNGTTEIAGRVRVRFDATYSPYAVDPQGRQFDRLYLDQTGVPFRFLDAGFSASTSLRGGEDGGSPELAPGRRRRPRVPDLSDNGGLYPYDYRRSDLDFVDFSVPWSLTLDLAYSYDRSFVPDRDDRQTFTLNGRFNLGLTPNWRLSGRSGYDFENKEITPTEISILRDLHCWEMSFNWTPFGTYRSFGFSIYVKSGYLRDLLRLDVPRSDQTDRFGSLTGGQF